MAEAVEGAEPGAAAGPFEPAEFARQFQQFVTAVNQLVRPPRSEIRDLLEQHMGSDPGVCPAVTENLTGPEHPNLQRALDELVGSADWQVIGLPLGLRSFEGFSLASIATDRLADYRLASPRRGPVEYVNVPVGRDETMPCVQLALYLGRWQDQPVATLVTRGNPNRGMPALTVEVLAAERDTALSFLAHLSERRAVHNVYRGKTLSFTFNQWGEFGLDFIPVPKLDRSQVILPEADLDAIEQHAIGISEHAEALRAAGRHLRRGLLLHGPPGTGKTLSVMYLCNRMPDRTTMVINGGPGIHGIGQAVAVARAAQPAMVVLEDVDLVAHERTMLDEGTNPLLFQLLNEMDGLAEDCDILFVLTTNRVDLLEPALAMRPGRVDQAVEIKLPDAACRQRLFDLYLEGAERGEVDVEPLVAATEGVSAAFIKELVRRAVLLAAMESAGGTGPTVEVGTGHLTTALAALNEASGAILRSLLGARSTATP